jgi:NADH:ubiquinone oxidoreductase subunit 2 (subunit N)
VVIAAVDAHSAPLAVVAMASAALAAFFYLRVTILMYGPDEEPAPVPVPALAPVGAPSDAEALRDHLNAALLFEPDGPEPLPEVVDAESGPDRVAVPLPALLAIGACIALTVVFGIIPAPLVDFAHKATLLFLP